MKSKSLLDKISFDFGKIILGAIILEGIFLLTGVLMYSKPLMVANAAGIILGVYLFIYGIFQIYEFLIRKSNPLYKFNIFLGFLSIILGVIIIVNPFKLIKILTITLGIYLILTAIFKAIDALRLKKYGFDGWLILLVTSVLLLIFGIFTAIDPLASMDIIEVAGIFIILASVLEICNLIMMYGKSKEIAKLLKK